MMMTHPTVGPVVLWESDASLAEAQTLPGAEAASIGFGGVRVGLQSSYVEPGMYVSGPPPGWHEPRVLVSWSEAGWRSEFGTMPEAV